MSVSANIGRHPDAESLNAFAERAMGAAEHGEVLAHLAVCGRCREIVVLAQQGGEVVPIRPAREFELVAAAAAAPVAAKQKAPWFRSLRYTWAPALALAGVAALVVVIHVRHTEQLAQSARNAERQAVEVARVETPKQPGVAGVLESAPAVAASKKSTSEKPSAGLGSRQQMASAAGGVALGSAQGTVAVEERQMAQLNAAEERSLDAQSTHYASGKAAVTEQVQVTAAPVATAGSAAGALVNAPAIKAAPAAPAAAPVARTPALFAARAKQPVLLPSGLEVASMINRGTVAVAIDSAGNAYLSGDRGAHWRQVVKQWTGRAVRVQLQLGSSESVRTKAADKIEQKSGANGAASIFELTNEQNAVWVSTDGLTWTPR